MKDFLTSVALNFVARAVQQVRVRARNSSIHHIPTVFALPSFRFHLIPPRPRCFAHRPRDRPRRSFCLAGSPSASPSAFRFSAEYIHEGLKATNVHHGHARFPKSGPINGRGQFDSAGPPRSHLDAARTPNRARTRYMTRLKRKRKRNKEKETKLKK